MTWQNPVPPGLEPRDDVVAQALRLVAAAPRERPLARVMRAIGAAYWCVVLAAFGWILAMALDRDPPVTGIVREILNPGGIVAPGERLLVRSTRARVRQCELTRRWAIVDGAGRRIDFEPEPPFDSYGPNGPDTDSQGPIVPLDAAPGRARYLSVLAWDCNPLQRALNWSIVMVQPPLDFEIRRPGPGSGSH